MIEPLLSDEAFLADVESVKGDPHPHLWWLGQSGYLLLRRKRRILLDPYLSDSLTQKYEKTDKPHVRMTRRVIDPTLLDDIDLITASHGHTDHLDPATLAAIADHDFPTLIAPRAIEKLVNERWPGDTLLVNAGETHAFGDIAITSVPAAHEQLDREPAGNYHYLGYVIRTGGFTIYHSGDTVRFDGMAELLAHFAPDVAILPINGRSPERRVAGNLTGSEAAQLAKDIGAKLVIPCHYEMFEFNTASPDEFIAACRRLDQPYRVLRAGERVSL